jgi:hypothetical protein
MEGSKKEKVSDLSHPIAGFFVCWKGKFHGLSRKDTGPMTLSEPPLPLHTCSVEVWPTTYQRLFRKSPSLVEVYNDCGGTARLFRLLREQPHVLLVAESGEIQFSQERSCYRQLLTDWHASQQTEPDAPARTIEDLQTRLFAPYRRLRTVLFEALEWRVCMERYNDPRALLLLEPPWKQTERDGWAALQLRLARSHMQWRLVIPRDVFATVHFPGSSLIAQDDHALWLASPQS